MKLKPIFFALIVIGLTSCSNNTVKQNIVINDYSKLDSIFDKHRSNNENIIAPVFIENIAPSIRNLTIAERKKIFIETLLANFVLSNDSILHTRNKIIKLSKKNHLNKKEKTWLQGICKIYRCKENNFEDLLTKVDIIPPSMAIAQSIVESGWGTSRFAIEGNSIFGEHHSNGANGKHIKADSSDIKMKAFDSIYEAVNSYSLNINRHKAYTQFRIKRLQQRKHNKGLNSLELVETLTSYSELGKEYTDYIKMFIRQNKLTSYDKIKLGNYKTEYFVSIKK
jgi:uncharacterized FlgJ-related protein